MTLTNVNRFWEWVRDSAEDRGWSIRELERRAGLKRGRISNAANLTRAPAIETLEGLSRALDVSLIDIQREAGYLPQPAGKDRAKEFDELVDILATLPDGPIRTEAMASIRAIAESARRRAQDDTH